MKPISQFLSIMLLVAISGFALSETIALQAGQRTSAHQANLDSGTSSNQTSTHNASSSRNVSNQTIVSNSSAIRDFNAASLAETWTTIEPTTGARPTKRHEAGFVAAGDRFYLIGGRRIEPVDVYDPVAQSWSERQQVPREMHHFQAVELDGLIYIVGAFEGNAFPREIPMPIVYIYDPTDDQWIEGSIIPEARLRGSAGVVVYNSKIYLVSGIQVGHESGWVKWTDVYDPATNSWEELPDAPRSRDHFHAGLADNKIVAAGGRNSGLNGSTFDYTISEVDVFDLTTNSWSTVSNNIPTPRAGTLAAAIGDEVIVIGGESSRSNAHAETEAFNVLTGDWRTLGDLNRERHGTQAIVSNGTIYVASGSGARGGSPELDSIEAFDFASPPVPHGDPLVESKLVPGTSNIDFGPLPLDSEQVVNVIFTNRDGNQAIVLTDIGLAGDGVFAYTFPYTLPIVIAPGATATVPIGFAPSSEQSYSAELVVQHSGADGETSVNIMGSGSNQTLPNQPPTVSSPIDDVVVDEDSDSISINLGLHFADPDQAASTLVYSVSVPSFPAVVLTSIGGSSLLLSPLLNANGTIPVTVQAVDDEGLSVSDEFNLTVRPINDAPYVIPNENRTIEEGKVVTVSISAVDVDQDLLDFDVKVEPNMDIASFSNGKDNNGTLIFKPGYSDAGLHVVTVTVTDPGQLSHSHQFSITVSDRNRTPILPETLPTVSLNSGDKITVTINALDIDGDAVLISAPDAPDFVAVYETVSTADGYVADLVIAPMEGDEGEYELIIKAIDPSGLFDEKPLSITVEAAVTPSPSPSPSPGSTLTPEPTASTTTAPGETPIPGSTSTPGVTPSPTSTPEPGVTPGASTTPDATATPPPNEPPVVSDIEETIVVTAAIPFTLTLSVADPNTGDTLTVAVSDAPVGLTLDASSANVDGTIRLYWNGAASAGSYQPTILVTDSGGLTATETFSLVIELADTGLPPQPVLGTGIVEAHANEAFSMTIQFVDPNADLVELSAVQLPTGTEFIDLGGGNGLVTWQPEVSQLGEHEIIIQAMDSTGLANQQRYTVTVAEPLEGDKQYNLYFPSYQ